MGAVLAGVMIALVVGWSLGWLARQVRGSRRDYRVTKASVAGLRRNAWVDLRKVTGRLTIVGFLLVAAIAGYLNNVDK